MKYFDLWMLEDEDAHEVAHDLTMKDLCEWLGVSRQAVYDSLNKGVIIQGLYQVYEAPAVDCLLDYMDGKAYSFAIYDKYTEKIYMDFEGGVVLTTEAVEKYNAVLTAPIEVISDSEQSYIIVDTENTELLSALMISLNGCSGENIGVNIDAKIVELSPSKVVTYNSYTGEVVENKLLSGSLYIQE